MKKLNDIRLQFLIWFAVTVVLGGFLSVVGEDAMTREHVLFWPLIGWIFIGIGWFLYRMFK